MGKRRKRARRALASQTPIVMAPKTPIIEKEEKPVVKKSAFMATAPISARSKKNFSSRCGTCQKGRCSGGCLFEGKK